MYTRLVTCASTVLVALGASFYLLETDPSIVSPRLRAPQLPLVSLILGGAVLLNRVKPTWIHALLALSLGPRTWSPGGGFRPDPGLQLQVFLVPAFFLVLWGVVLCFLLFVELLAPVPGDSMRASLVVLLLLALAFSVRELGRICQESFASSNDRAA